MISGRVTSSDCCRGRKCAGSDLSGRERHNHTVQKLVVHPSVRAVIHGTANIRIEDSAVLHPVPDSTVRVAVSRAETTSTIRIDLLRIVVCRCVGRVDNFSLTVSRGKRYSGLRHCILCCLIGGISGSRSSGNLSLSFLSPDPRQLSLRECLLRTRTIRVRQGRSRCRRALRPTSAGRVTRHQHHIVVSRRLKLSHHHIATTRRLNRAYQVLCTIANDVRIGAQMNLNTREVIRRDETVQVGALPPNRDTGRCRNQDRSRRLGRGRADTRGSTIATVRVTANVHNLTPISILHKDTTTILDGAIP